MKKNGTAIAGLFSSGLGVVSLGLLIILSEAHASLKNALVFDGPVGPLSGKTTVAILIWLFSWAVLHLLWRNQELPWNRWWKISSGTLIVGFFLCFPPIYDLLAKFM
jgi:hypothetical protein